MFLDVYESKPEMGVDIPGDLDLLAYSLLNEGAGTSVRDLINPTIVGSVNSPATWGFNPSGQAIVNSSAGNVNYGTTFTLNGRGSFTLIAVGMGPGNTSDHLGGQGNGTAFGGIFKLSTTTARIMRFLSQIGGSTKTATSSVQFDASVPHVWVATYDGATVTLYQDGMSVGTAAGTGNVTGSGNFRWFLASDGGTGNNWPGSLNMWGVASRAWTAGEVLEFSTNIYHYALPSLIGASIYSTAIASQSLSPTGIASAEAWGSSFISGSNSATISPAGIASGEAWGTAALSGSSGAISPTGIASDEAWGVASLIGVSAVISPTGIASGEAWGSHIITQQLPQDCVGGCTITPTGIPSGEAWGSAAIYIPGAGGGTNGGNSLMLDPFLGF